MTTQTTPAMNRTITLTSEQWKVLSEALSCACDEGPAGQGWESASLSSAVAALEVQLSEPEKNAGPLSNNPWHDVIDDALVCRFILNDQNYDNPKQALNDIINWEVMVAQDPRVAKNPLLAPIAVDHQEQVPEEDCDEERRCWRFQRESFGANAFWYYGRSNGTESHYLPHWALPRPQLEPIAQWH